MDSCNRNGVLTQYLLKKGLVEVFVSNKHIALEKTRSLEVVS